ncbi:hypothetical protein HU762_00375 [Pseudomonas sp. SWRI92]|uniref:hypothetical protein n=1 Tax=Pseudomonas sp. SWRI92 TaxID=2745499 RepID=UPI0016477339|nr:hypothetical protein [Pseudomonas sp. SWRI92]MBC3372379.1 hypothetical protein [Pseudomonas sp. SWRI92]
MKIDPRPLLPTTTGKTPATDPVQPANVRQGARFETVLSKREVLARRSLRGDVEQSSSVDGIAAQLFGSTRSLEILEYVLHNVLPGLDAETEVKTLAHELISEEIDMRRSLEQQRAEVQA